MPFGLVPKISERCFFLYNFSKKHILELEVPKRWVCHNRDCDTECIHLNCYPKIQIYCQNTLGATTFKISFLIWLGCICIILISLQDSLQNDRAIPKIKHYSQLLRKKIELRTLMLHFICVVE